MYISSKLPHTFLFFIICIIFFKNSDVACRSVLLR